jgi:hypothetical protein
VFRLTRWKPVRQDWHPYIVKGSVQPNLGRARDCVPGTVEDEEKISNLILTSLPKDEYDLVVQELEFVPMEWHHLLQEPGVPIKFAYFPNGGIISFVVPVKDGRSAEVGMVGREGLVGVALAGGWIEVLTWRWCRSLRRLLGCEPKLLRNSSFQLQISALSY